MSNQHLARGPWRRKVDRSHGPVVIYGAPWNLHFSVNRWVQITLAWTRKRRSEPSIEVVLREER